ARSRLTMTSEETAEVLDRILLGYWHIPQLVVSTGSLDDRLAMWVRLDRAAKPAAKRAYVRPELGTKLVAPATELEQAVADIWSELLGIANIGVRDNFFELGGDSLIAIQIVSRIRARLRVELPFRRLFEDPTVEGVCRIVTAAQAEASSELAIEELLTEIE